MALLPGQVVIGPDGNPTTKTGMAGDIYDQFMLPANFKADTGMDLPSIPADLVPIARSMASLATRLAAGIVGHVTANAVATVTMPATPAGDGYQRDADGANPDCLGPLAPKTLSGTVS